MNHGTTPSRRRTLADTLQKLLDSGVGERDGLAPFVKKYPKILKDALMPYEGSIVRGVSEFRLGNELKADYALLIGQSHGFILNLVELESSTDALLNKKGEHSRRFNHAYCQVQRWQEYARHPAKSMGLKLEVERQFRDHESLVPGLKGQSPNDNTGKYPLNHSASNLHLRFTIIIGCRDALTDAEVARKETLRNASVEVVSWDRLRDAARSYFLSGRKIPPAPYNSEEENMTIADLEAMLAEMKQKTVE